jgi:hypothetical protein
LNPHHGSSLESFLDEEGIKEEATEAAIKKVADWRKFIFGEMDKQVEALRGDIVVHNPFTRMRIVDIWKMIKESEAI